MAGDVNAFRGDDGFELSVMVAQPEFRRRGLGSEAIILMAAYIMNQIGGTEFVAKISKNNAASKLLFEKLHFYEDSFSDVFQTYTYKNKRSFIDILARTPLILEKYGPDLQALFPTNYNNKTRCYNKWINNWINQYRKCVFLNKLFTDTS